ncbi:MAG: riboflavin synthase [Candidatus Nanopelagicales bacterium]
MFTGIVEQTGTVTQIVTLPDSAARITVTGPNVMADANKGDSISVNGVCLTVVEFDETGFTADVMKETLDRSNVGTLEIGSKVNLERAMQVGDRFGGHIVSGHVDGIGTLTNRETSANWKVFTFEMPSSLGSLVSEKGSITVNGVSLTVTKVSEPNSNEAWFSVSLIPTTLQDTNLGMLNIGDSVNLEVDVLARYVDRINQSQSAKEGVA